MSTSNSLRSAIRRALLTNAVTALAFAAFAPAQAAQQDNTISEVIVTGSRIARPDLEASVPVQLISAENVDQQGSPNMADILAELPSVGTPNMSRTNSNFAVISNGVSTINLRNVQDQRTLVLINSRRVVSGAGGTSTVDLNNIPTELIESVQVLTGGASAVYGSEAIAGVVNFVLKNDFEGLSVRAQTGMSAEEDSERHLFSLTGGINIGDRGNVTANIQYDKDDGLRSSQRALSANDIPFRSGITPQGVFNLSNVVGPGGIRGSTWTYNPDNTLKQGFVNGVDGFNRNAKRYIAVPLERSLVTVLADYDLTDSTRLFFEGGYSRMESNSSLEPLATDNSDAVLPDGTISSGLSLDNPFIPAAISAQMLALGVDTLPMVKRMSGVFDRSNQNERDFFRGVIGLEGELGVQWSWDVYYNQSQTQEATASETALRDRYYYALDAIANPAGGNPICRDAAARAAGCVPFNPFGFNSVSTEVANYITANGILDTYDATIDQRVVAANVTGPVFAMPGGDAKIAAGIEYREEKSSERYSPETQAGNTMGNALSNTLGEYDVKEVYLETVIPILSDAPFARSLDVEAAIRVGDYSTVGKVTSWKGGATWAPSQDVRFRAVYSNATRAPNIGELYSGALQTFPTGLSDPCEGVTASTAGPVAAYCRSIPGIAQQIAANGVFEYNDNSDRQQIEGFDRGNPAVNEETARTWTVGVVLTPQALRGFTVSIDWFKIEIEDAISLAPRQVSINDCVNSLGTSPLCALIVREQVGTPRSRTPGTVFSIDSLPLNAASIKTSGVDVATAYAMQFGNDQRLAFTLAYTYLDELSLQPRVDLAPVNNKGQLDGSGRLSAGFEHRANLGVTYSLGRFSANWRVNYLSAIKDTLEENGPLLPASANSIDAYAYHDLQARYRFGADEQYDLFVGADNVFDKKPPLIDQNGASNVTGTETAADSYDPFGRYFYAGVEVNF